MAESRPTPAPDVDESIKIERRRWPATPLVLPGPVAAIVGLSAIAIAALFTGHDGTFLNLLVGMIAALAGLTHVVKSKNGAD